MSHAETNPFVCSCNCHGKSQDRTARIRHAYPCCVGECPGCHKNYRTYDALVACQKAHLERIQEHFPAISQDDFPTMPW